MSIVASGRLAVLCGGLLCNITCCTPPSASGSTRLTSCRIGAPSLPAECGQLDVPENRQSGEGRRISVHFAVIRALRPRPTSPPLLILVGGPGQAATKAGVPIARVLSQVRLHHDVVLIDQRGTGESHPLRCPAEELPLSLQFSHVPSEQDVTTCLANLDADTTHYTTLSAIADFEDVRQTLGYRRWHLWGGSYGTRVALAYAQHHPARIERVVLDGAAPTDIELPLHFAVDGEASLDALQKQCASDSACRERFRPVRETLASLLGKLDAGTIAAAITHPQKGTLESVPLTKEGFLGGLRTLLYSSELTSLLPYALERADAYDDWSPFITAATALTDVISEQATHFGMYLSVVCAEDVSRITDDESVGHGKGTVFGVALVDRAKTWCGQWKAATMPEAYFAPVRTEHPTLVLSGERDPATPPRWGELVAERLPNARHIVLAGAGHGVTALGCVPEIIDEFLTSGEPLAVDASCAQRVTAPPLFTRPTGY